MTFILATIVILFGTALFYFTVGNILLAIFFTIPLTNKLDKNNLLKSNNYIVRSYIISVFFQFIILFGVTFVFYMFFKDSVFISLMIGYSFGLLAILTKINSFKLTIKVFFFAFL